MKPLTYDKAVLYANRMMKSHPLFCGMDMVHNLVAFGIALTITNIRRECYGHYDPKVKSRHADKILSCNKCGEAKPAGNFSIATEKRRGMHFSYYTSICNTCSWKATRVRERQNKQKHREQSNIRSRRYYGKVYADPQKRKKHLDACTKNQAYAIRNITDTYIRVVIKKEQGYVKGEAITQERIEAKRISIQERRRKLNNTII